MLSSSTSSIQYHNLSVPKRHEQKPVCTSTEDTTAVNPSQDNKLTTTVCDSEAEADSLLEHLPEPPASPTSNTLLSTSSGSTYGGEPGSQNIPGSCPPSPMKTDAKAVKTPSANRLSISYAAGSRRLVVDAGVVDKLRVFRSDGRIEAVINLERESENNGLKGILIEGLSETTKSYAPLPTLPSGDSSSTPDPTLPTFAQAHIPSKIMLIAYLDIDRPLSEPKWVKSGDVQEWLKSMFGRMFWVAGDAADGWEKKIEVVEQVRATNTSERLSRREGRLAWCTNKGGGRANANERPSGSTTPLSHTS